MVNRSIKDESAFEPEAIAAMAEAFASACNALRIFAGDAHGREVIAARVIDLARSGVTEPAVMVQRIVAESRVVA